MHISIFGYRGTGTWKKIFINYMNKETILKYLTCSSTNLIFSDPVIAEDGFVYEAMAIRDWLVKNNTSPITGDTMGNTLIKAKTIKKMTDDFLGENPEYITDQFLFKKPFYLFEKEFLDALKNKTYGKIPEFTTFLLNYDMGKETLIEYLTKNCPNEVIIHVIKNSIDYDIKDKRGNKPLHILCKYSNSEIIKYFLQKDIDLESEDHLGNRAINYLIINQVDNELIRLVLDMNIDINFENKVGLRPVNYAVTYGNIELIKLLIEYNVDTNFSSSKVFGYNLLQYTFKHSDKPEIIKLIIDNNINLDIDVDPKTTCEQLIYQNEKLVNKRDQQMLVLYYLNKILNKPIVVDNYITSESTLG